MQNTLSKEEIKNIIEKNAKEDGFYSHLHQKIKKDKSMLSKLENLACKDKTELEMTLEG